MEHLNCLKWCFFILTSAFVIMRGTFHIVLLHGADAIMRSSYDIIFDCLNKAFVFDFHVSATLFIISGRFCYYITTYFGLELILFWRMLKKSFAEMNLSFLHSESVFSKIEGFSTACSKSLYF